MNFKSCYIVPKKQSFVNLKLPVSPVGSPASSTKTATAFIIKNVSPSICTILVHILKRIASLMCDIVLKGVFCKIGIAFGTHNNVIDLQQSFAFPDAHAQASSRMNLNWHPACVARK
jgi:hypothetical protein